MIVYALFHLNVDESGVSDRKLIGFFSSYSIAKTVIKRYSKVSGFIDFPNGFKIKPYYMNEKTGVSIKNKNVYFLQYEYSKDDIDYVIDLGLYSSKVRATIEAIRFGLSLLIKKQQGKVKLGGRFYNVAYKLNKVFWREGFFTYKNKI